MAISKKKREAVKKLRPFLAALLIQLNIGSLYAWNMLSSELMERYGFNGRSMGVIFGITLLAFTGSMIPAGRLLHRFSEKRITLFATVAYGLGFFLSGISGGNYLLILLGNGLLVGIGTGIGYVSSMTYGAAPFKDKSIPTGLITMSFALSSIISSNVVALLVKWGFEIDLILQLFSIGQLLLMACAIMLYPCSTCGKKTNEDAKTKEKSTAPPIKWRETLPLCIGMFSATFGGLLVISNMKQIVSALDSSSTIVISLTIALFSAGNALGRILLGLLPIKRYRVTIAVIMLSFMATLLLMCISHTPVQLYLLIFFCGVQFGSFFVLFPLATLNRFGPQSLSHVYPIIFIAYGIAAAVSATLGGTLYDLFDSPQISLSTAGVIECIGAIILLLALKKSSPITV